MLNQEEKNLLIEVTKARHKIRTTDLLEVGITICINGVIWIGTGQEKE